IAAPVEGQPRMTKRRNDYQKSLDPHPGADEERCEGQQSDRAQSLEREDRHWNDKTAEEHRVEERRVWPPDLRPEDCHLSRLIGVPDSQVLGECKVETEQAHRQKKQRETVEVALLKICLEMKDAPDHRHGDD